MKKLNFRIYIVSLFIIFSCSPIVLGNLSISHVNSGSGVSQLNGFAQTVNPGLLFQTDTNFVNFFYSPSKFGLKELNTMGILTGKRFFDNTIFAISLNGNNGELYGEYSLSLNIAQRFKDVGILAMKVDYSSIHIRNYGEHSKYSFDFAGSLEITDYLRSGFLIRNANRAYYKKDDFINQEVYCGFGLIPMRNLFIDLDALINIGSNSGFSVSIAYLIEDYLKVRTAYQSNRKIIEGGIEIFTLDIFSLVLSGSYEPTLGYSYIFGGNIKF